MVSVLLEGACWLFSRQDVYCKHQQTDKHGALQCLMLMQETQHAERSWKVIADSSKQHMNNHSHLDVVSPT